MMLDVRVMPGAKRSMIRKEADRWKIYVTAPALEGRANKAVIEALAAHFKARKSQIQIIKGLKSRDKTINIEGI